MFSRTENFSQYIRLYPVVTFFLALNILIYRSDAVPIYREQVFIRRHGHQLSYLRRGMVATSLHRCSYMAVSCTFCLICFLFSFSDLNLRKSQESTFPDNLYAFGYFR